MSLPSVNETVLEDLPKRFPTMCSRSSSVDLSITISAWCTDVPDPTKVQTQENLDIIRALLESYVVDRRPIVL